MSELWHQLLSSAIVGTQRRPCRPGPVGGPLATLIPTGELDAEGILSAVAGLTVIRRAARLPRHAKPPQPATADTAAVAPPRAAARLGRLIGDLGGLNYRHRLALLVEWLELACARQLLAPPRYLAALADLATGELELRPLVRRTGGTRLAWLAEVNAGAWSWVQAVETAPSQEDWLTGTIEARARYLGATRAADASGGRALLEEVWPREKAADLAVLIAACTNGLSLDDEPWLEKALDDRRVQVREAAAALLAVLPGSAFQERAAQRALACCRLDRQGRIEVVLPEAFDAGMRRDGLSLKPPQGMGEKAWWLLQIVATAPLRCWSTLDNDPIALLDRKARDDWTGLLRQGWARAAVRQRDAAWALALARHPSAQGAEFAQLLSVLPTDALRREATKLVGAGDSRVAEVLQATPAPWPPALTEAVLSHLRGGTVGRQGYWWALALAAERRLDPAAALPAIRELVPQSEGRLRDALERLEETLTVRLEMHQEFA